MQDLVATSSAVFVDCNVDKMFNTLTHMFTTEGVTELSGRLGGAAFFELSDCLDVWNDGDNFSTADASKIYGKCFSVLLNFTI